MTDEVIYLENRLLADFMGYKVEREEIGDGIYDYFWKNTPMGLIWTSINPPPFNESWNWLMPVIEKINNLGYDVAINSGLRRINISTSDFGYINKVAEYNEEFRGNSSIYEFLLPIECVWSAILDFIKWYNNINKK
jgi:hypothetical protein